MSGEGQSESPEQAAEPARPVLRVVKGDPSAEELAALVSVVAARSRASAASARSSQSRARSAWGDPALATRPVMRVGPGGWRHSAFPG